MAMHFSKDGHIMRFNWTRWRVVITCMDGRESVRTMLSGGRMQSSELGCGQQMKWMKKSYDDVPTRAKKSVSGSEYT
jgi:hypothetical protein